MKKYMLIHIPHSSLYIKEEYKNKALIPRTLLEEENIFMCDFKVDQLITDKTQAVIFPYSRLYCDVERFKDNSEPMNKYGMGYIYTKTSKGLPMFNPSDIEKEEITKIYDDHHHLMDQTVTKILTNYKKCIIIDLHSYSNELVNRLFNYTDVPDICIGIEEDYYSEELTNHFINHFKKNGYSVQINYPYKGSFIPNKYYGKKDTNIISIMIEINKRVYNDDFDKFKEVLEKSLDF